METFWHMKMHECAFLMQKLLRFSVINSTEQVLTQKPRNFKHLSFNTVSLSSLTFCFLWQESSFVTVIQDLICKLTKACGCDENSWAKKRKLFHIKVFQMSCPAQMSCPSPIFSLHTRSSSSVSLYLLKFSCCWVSLNFLSCPIHFWISGPSSYMFCTKSTYYVQKEMPACSLS